MPSRPARPRRLHPGHRLGQRLGHRPGLALALSVAFATAAGGCYETPKPACAFACGQDGSCPDGYGCDPQDQICHRVLEGGALEACAIPFVDAAPIDGRPIDASTPDAAVDAAVDAAIDAP